MQTWQTIARTVGPLDTTATLVVPHIAGLACNYVVTWFTQSLFIQNSQLLQFFGVFALTVIHRV